MTGLRRVRRTKRYARHRVFDKVVLKKELGWLYRVVRAKGPARPPVALTLEGWTPGAMGKRLET